MPADGAVAAAALTWLDTLLDANADLSRVRSVLVQYRHLLQWLVGPAGLGDSPETVAALRACARLHHYGFREPGQAVGLYARVVAIKEAQNGADHPSVAVALMQLATAFTETGDPAHAATLLERAVAIREAKYGPDHPQVAAVLQLLAAAYRAVADSERAQLELAIALEMQPKTKRPVGTLRRLTSGGSGANIATPSPSSADLLANVPVTATGTAAAAAAASPSSSFHTPLDTSCSRVPSAMAIPPAALTSLTAVS